MKALQALIAASIKIGLSYRMWMISTSLANLLYIVVIYYLWQAIYAGSAELNGMSFNDSFVYLALAGTLFAVLITYVDYDMSDSIRDGSIAIDLLRPIDYQLLQLSGMIGFALQNVVFIVLPALFLVVVVLDMPLSVGSTVWWLLPALCFAFLISFFLDYSVGCFAFYTESIWGIFTTKETIIMVFSGVLVPFAFFPDWLQAILAWSPFIAIFHTPVAIFLGQVPGGSGEILQLLANQLLWLVVLFFASRHFFSRASQVLTVNGG